MPEPLDLDDYRTFFLPLLKVLARREPGKSPEWQRYREVCEGVVTLMGLAEAPAESGCFTEQPYAAQIERAALALMDSEWVYGPKDEGWRPGEWKISCAGELMVTSEREGYDEAMKQWAARRVVSIGGKQRRQDRHEGRVRAGLAPLAEGHGTSEVFEAVEALTPAAAPALLEALVDAESAPAFTRMHGYLRVMEAPAFEALAIRVMEVALGAEDLKVEGRSEAAVWGHARLRGARLARPGAFRVHRAGPDATAYALTVSKGAFNRFVDEARDRGQAAALFLTVGRFEPSVIELAAAQGVRLVDGPALLDLMAAHGIGFRTRRAYTVYDIDPSWPTSDALHARGHLPPRGTCHESHAMSQDRA